MSKEKLSPLFKLRNVIFDLEHDSRQTLLGKILTIIDASIADPEQRKAVKDIIKPEFYRGDPLNSGIRYAILEFAYKYAPDLTPQTSDEKNSFLGRISNLRDDSTPTEEPLTNYFN